MKSGRAQAGDEFEIVALEAGWAEVRLSPEATGYVQADELQLPGASVERPADAAHASALSSNSAGTAASEVATTAARSSDRFWCCTIADGAFLGPRNFKDCG